jgi:hypothetical protein
MALNNSAVFPPIGNAPYRINREWCIGDSLGYINANSENFDNRIITLETKTNTGSTSSPLYHINNKLIQAPLFIPANYSNTTLSNENVTLGTWRLNSTTPQYAGPIKTWYSPNFSVSIPNLPLNTVGVSINVKFNANTKGNNAIGFLLKKRNALVDNSTYPTASQLSNYTTKFTQDPSGGSGAAWEAEAFSTMTAYLDTTGIFPNTFSWRIFDVKRANPWDTKTAYNIEIYLLGYFVRNTTYLTA